MNTFQRFTFAALVSLVALSGCGADSVAEFDVNGVVAGVHQDRQVIDLVHDEIPGYMPAMQMPFPVERPELLEGLRMGDQVSFHLTITNAAATLTDIVRLPSFAGALPAWELENMAGDTVSSADFEGKVTVINFWASWCQPCKVEMPILNQMTADYPESEFAVVGIAQDPESRDAIAQVLEELDIQYPIVLTEGVLEGAVGGIPVIPGTMVVDKDGQVADKRLGIADETELRALVESLL
jgi:thiol-disulfide isomerase/thioredoxin